MNIKKIFGMLPCLLFNQNCTAGTKITGAGDPDLVEEKMMERIKKSPHYSNGKFLNSLPMQEDLFKALKHFLGSELNRVPHSPLPVVSRTRQDFAAPPKDNLRVTWIGHSTLLVEMDSLVFLTDPVFVKRASPVQFAGPEHPFLTPCEAGILVL